jgi:membrane protein
VGAGSKLLGLLGRKPKTKPRAADPYPSSGRPQSSQSSRSSGEPAKPGPSPEQVPGGLADSPTQIPAQGWKQVLQRTKQQIKEDNIPLLAAGVAFYAFIALFPALIAAVTVYGLVADPETVEEQIGSFSDALPREAASLLTEQLTEIAGGSSSALGWGLLLSLGGALFAASGGMQNLIKAVNIAYDEEETRGFLKLRGLALALTLGAIVFIVVAIGLVAVVPVVLDAAGLGAAGRIAAQVARWLGLVVFVLIALGVIYRFAPDRDDPKLKWVGLGSAVATLLWIIGSAAFSLYVSNFGKYGETYGALAGVVILLLWLWLTSLIILVGAEINSETEQQTAKDTTQGPEKPMGQRRAVKADSLPT